MEQYLLFDYPGNKALTSALSAQLNIEIGSFELRDFPDGETYLRLDSKVKDRIAVLVCTLDHPNHKILPLMFLAKTLKELGAAQICLIAPYLPYLRQDKRFRPGEALTSAIFAKYVSGWIDSLVSIDPHLHRIPALSQLYDLPRISTLHITDLISKWLEEQIESPILIGPDAESEQWVGTIADKINAPYVIIKKIRLGDRKVEISLPTIRNTNKTPILVDDIISTGTSMLAALQKLSSQGLKKATCITVHALFDKKIYKKILDAGAEKIISSNTIPHFSNAIDVSELLAKTLKKFLHFN